jgi:hypothetical protein
MKLLDELIKSLAGALMKTKVLLHQLGRKELVDWVNVELNGYPDDGSVPPYRVINAEVMGNVSNGVYTFNDQHLATLHLGEELRSKFRRFEVRESISSLEGLALKDSKEGLMVPIAPEFNGLLSKPLAATYSIQRAWRAIAVGQIVQILTQVRSRLLDFLLELSEKVGENMTDEDVKRVGRSPETASMFNHAIFGDNVTITVGDYNRQIVNNRITTGDFEGLRSLLLERKVGVVDIEDLSSAIQADADGEDVGAKRFGPRVRDWIKTMLSKAVDASWEMPVGVASNLLTDALKAYYGW